MTSSTPAAKKTSGKILAHVGGFIAVMFWGLSFVSTSIIMDPAEPGHLSPTEAYIYRFVVAYVIVILISHKKLFCNSWRDEFYLLLCGMSSGSIYFIAENTALEMTLTTNVSLMSSLSPLVTILLVSLLYKNDKPGKGVVIGSVIAFCGVLCVIFNSMTGSFEIKISPLGDLIALSTAFCWAIYSLVLKRVNVTYDTMFITRKTFFYGIITAIPFLLMQKSITSPVVAFSNPMIAGNILFLALGASIISFYLWAITVDKLGAVKANNYMYLQPIITLIASAIILGEKITILGVTGLALILFGLWFGDYLQARKIKRS